MTSESFEGARLFTESARHIVDYLTQHTPLSTWSVSRIGGGEQVHVHVAGGSLITTGQRVPWDVTFCKQMSEGAASIVPDSHHDRSYCRLPASAEVRSYAGVPLTDDDGDLFGTLCGVGPQPLADASLVEPELIELFGRLLSAQLISSREQDRDDHEAALARAEAQSDALTGLLNRRGWDLVAGEAQDRVDAYADPVAVIVIDLDGLKQINDREGHVHGDALLRRAATTLRAAAGPEDQVARYGGDEFSVLCNGLTTADSAGRLADLLGALHTAGVAASGGIALTTPGPESVLRAFEQADRAMYADKQERRSS